MKQLFFILVTAFFGSSFFPFHPAEKGAAPRRSNCAGDAAPFQGYTFLYPEIINKNAAFAPFFLKWDDYYERFYYARDIQKEENIEEWIGRFCGQPLAKDVEFVVYKADAYALAGLRRAATDKSKKTTLPYALNGNTFAEMIVINGCADVVDYITFARKCEPHVIAYGDGWTPRDRDPVQMQQLIEEAKNRFTGSPSHFLRLRYLYQMVRLAHYMGDWNQTVSLYNYYITRVDRRKSSIIFFWAMAHQAGALLQLGHYPEAAYRFSLVFRYCASKRTQAYRSFLIRNDKDWEKALQLCGDDTERATLHLLRSGGTRQFAVQDMETIYKLEPENPQIDLLLVSDVQELEKVFLRTRVTDQLHGNAKGLIEREKGAAHLLGLKQFVAKVLNEGHTPNRKLWRGITGYLDLLAGDYYAAEKTFDRLMSDLDDEEEYEQKLIRQIEIWRVLLDIVKLDPRTAYVDQKAFQIRSLEAYKYNPNFEPFLKDWLSAGYAASNNPGKAILAAYSPSALMYNPDLAILDDLLKVAVSDDPDFLEYAMQIDTNPEQIKAYLLEIKGTMLLAQGEPEAALAVMRNIIPSEQAKMPRFAPFREVFGEKVHRIFIRTDSLLLNRIEISRKLLDFAFRAKAAETLNPAEASWYYYLLGLAYYNMSYFGHEWKAADYYRSGYNWGRLSQGPVFSLRGVPNGNRENTDVSKALNYFEKAIRNAQTAELAARAAFLAARCEQKMYFCDPECRYRQGSALIPELPVRYSRYYDYLIKNYRQTQFYQAVVKECKWLEAYARR